MHSEVTDKVCLLTGASSGVGRAAALQLAERGVRLVLLGRDRRRSEAMFEEVQRRTGLGRVELLIADLSSQTEVRRVANEVCARCDRLDLLINNAGLVTSRRTLALDGIETILAVNHLAPFLLTNLLLDRLAAAGPARIVTVASTAHRSGTIHFDDLQGEQRWSAFGAYAQSKLANILFTYELARRLSGRAVTANCVHPGVVASRIFNNTPWPARALILPMTLFFISPAKGAEGLVKLALAPELEGVSGRYYERTSEARSTSQSHDAEIARRLWDVSAQMTGLVSMAAPAA